MQLEYGCNRRGYIRGIELRTSRWCSGYAVDAVANICEGKTLLPLHINDKRRMKLEWNKTKHKIDAVTYSTKSLYCI